MLDRCFDVVLLYWRGRNWRKDITLVGNRGVIYWLLAFIYCGPRDVRRSWGCGVSRGIAISAAMVVNSWVMLRAANGCSNVANGAEIPEVFWIAVLLTGDSLQYCKLKREAESRTRRNREPVHGRRTCLCPPPSTFRVVR